MNVVFLNDPNYINEVLVVRNRNFVKGRPLELAKNLLGEGLLTSDGEVHRRQRRLVQPAFNHDRIKGYARVMTEYACRASQRWTDGQTIDVSQEMMRMALGISGKTMFNADTEDAAEKVGAALVAAMKLFDRLSIPLIEVLLKLPVPSTLRFRRSKRILNSMIYQIIREHPTGDQGDLLSLLLMARDHEFDGSGMSSEELRDQVLIFFLAAYDTTALALTWTWYLLSRHPEAERALHAELAAVLNGRIPTTEDLPRLKYTRAIFAESLRLYPPGYIIARRALDDFHLDGYFIPRGSTILMSPYIIHRDARFYNSPEEFDPNRWLHRSNAERPKHAYFPFGGGPRICIGEDFSWTEGILVLAILAQQWRFHLAPDQVVAYLPLLNLRPKYGMRMIAECRHDVRRQSLVAL